MSDREGPGNERGWGTGESESDDIEQSSENVLEGWPATSVDEPPEAPGEPEAESESESESFAPVAQTRAGPRVLPACGGARRRARAGPGARAAARARRRARAWPRAGRRPGGGRGAV